jgi:HEAT repeat protein
MVAALRSSDASAGLRRAALSTLSRLRTLGRHTVAVLRGALGDACPGVRAQAAPLLGKHAGVEASADVAALLGDGDPDVRKAALATLARLPGTDWEPAARAALRDACEPVVFEALCLLKDARRLRAADVEPLFRSPDPAVRRKALWASDAIQGEGVAIPEDLLRDPDAHVRNYAIGRWGRGDPRRVAVLVEMLRAEANLDVLACLVKTLGEIGDAEGVPALIEMTGHADAFLRQDAARALGKLADRRAIPALMALLSDRTKPYRRTEHGSSSNAYTVAEVARAALAQIAKS